MGPTYKDLLSDWEKKELSQQQMELYAAAISNNASTFFSLKGNALLEMLKKLRIIYHPDKNIDKPVFSHIIFKAINSAYIQLKDPTATPEIKKDEFNYTAQENNSHIVNTIKNMIKNGEHLHNIKFQYLQNIYSFTQDQINELRGFASSFGNIALIMLFMDIPDNDDDYNQIADPNNEEIMRKNLSAIFHGSFVNFKFELTNNRDACLLEYRNNFENLPYNVQADFLYLSAEFETTEQFKHLYNNFPKDKLPNLDKRDESLFHAVAKSYMQDPKICFEKFEFLIAMDKSKINGKNKKGESPLMVLIGTMIGRKPDNQALKLLLNNGASIYFSTKTKFISQEEGNTPLYLATKSAYAVDLLQTFEPFWPNPQEIDLLWTALKSTETLQWLLQRFPSGSINIIDTHNNTLLHKAIEEGYANTAAYLLPILSLDAKNKLGQTPVHLLFNSINSMNIFDILKKHLQNNKSKTLNDYFLEKDNSGKNVIDSVFTNLINSQAIKSEITNNLNIVINLFNEKIIDQNEIKNKIEYLFRNNKIGYNVKNTFASKFNFKVTKREKPKESPPKKQRIATKAALPTPLPSSNTTSFPQNYQLVFWSPPANINTSLKREDFTATTTTEIYSNFNNSTSSSSSSNNSK